jgi:hypothetical protein
MQPNLHDETADRAAEERSEDDGMPEHQPRPVTRRSGPRSAL